MAQTLRVRLPRLVGSTTNSPPPVKTFPAGEDSITVGEFLSIKNDGEVYLIDGNALTGDEQLDVTDLATIATDGVVCGLALNAGDEGDLISVALATVNSVFEATLCDSADGATFGELVSTIGNAAAGVSLQYHAAATNATYYTGWCVSTDNGTGATEGIGQVIEVGYGLLGEDIFSGHGVIGDTNVRVHFQFTPFIESATLYGRLQY